MNFLRKYARSADLATGMAQRLGVDLDASLSANPVLDAGGLNAIVMRCSGCSDQDGCTALQAGNPTLHEPPHYCRNQDRLAAMARG